jgi:hypothetical protein
VNQHKSIFVAMCFSLLVLWQIQPALAQTATSDQSQNLSNDQSFNQQGGSQQHCPAVSVPLRGFPFPGESPLPPLYPYRRISPRR